VERHPLTWQGMTGDSYERLRREAERERVDRRTPLMKAASAGDVARVRALLARGAEVDAATEPVPGSLFFEGGRTALMFAARSGSADTVRALLDAGADPNRVADDGDTAVADAARDGALDVLAVLLERGAMLRPQGAKHTPLASAAYYGRTAVIDELLDRGADPNEPVWTGAVPLHGAARGAHIDAMRLLLARGARANERDRDGRTPLMAVVTADLDDVELFMRYDEEAMARLCEAAHILLDAGADVRIRDEEGFTALDRICARTCDHFALARLLVEKGAETSVANGSGMPPIVAAARLHNTTVAALLIDHGAALDARDATGKTALEHAIENRYDDLVQLLTELTDPSAAPRAIEPSPTTRHVVGSASARFGTRDFAGALALYEQIPASLRTRIPGLASNLGYCHQALGNHREALALFEQAVTRKPDLAHTARAACFSAYSLEDWPAMQRFADRAVAAAPDDDYAWQQLGIAAHVQGDHAAAARAYRRALELNPANASASTNLAALEAEATAEPADQPTRRQMHAGLVSTTRGSR
jgi:ankyrin repeat protein